MDCQIAASLAAELVLGMIPADQTYDNDYAQSLFSRSQAELLKGDAHSARGYFSPDEYERTYFHNQPIIIVKSLP